MAFNIDQTAAINADNPCILASAGAGSGKSTVMTERVMRLIREGKSTIDHMLVITFTNDAASSIRDKIHRALFSELSSDVCRLNAGLFDKACIATIHKFCERVLRSGAALVDISQDFGVMDTSLQPKYFKQAFDTALEKISEKSYPKERKAMFGALCRALPIDELFNACTTVYPALMGVPDPFVRFHDLVALCDAPVAENPWALKVISAQKLLIASKKSTLDRFKAWRTSSDFPASLLGVLDMDIALLEGLLACFDTLTDIKSMVDAIHTVTDNMTGIRKSKSFSPAELAVYEEYSALRNKLKNKPAGLASKHPGLSTAASDYLLFSAVQLENLTDRNNVLDNQRIRKQLEGLDVLLNEFHLAYLGIKQSLNVVDFNDMEQFAYKILTHESVCDIRDEYRKQYPYVFVDECQDVSAIQFAIISALKSDDSNMFFVGDIKQSIYKFRHAEPRLFLDMRDRFSEAVDASERKIYFKHNYRSSATILECVNRVFDKLLRRDLTEIDYEEGDRLLPGRDDIESSPTEIVLVAKPDGKTAPDDIPMKEAQCAEVIDIIKDCLDKGFSYKDIVILSRQTKSIGAQYVAWLANAHIPAYFSGKQSFFGLKEVTDVLSILETIVDSTHDIALATTLRNHPFGFSDVELASIRSFYGHEKDMPYWKAFEKCAESDTSDLGDKCRQAMTMFDLWRTRAATARTSDIIWMLLKEYGIFAVQSAMPGEDLRRKNLYALHAKAIEFEERNQSYKIFDFLRYVRDIRNGSNGSGDAPAPLCGTDDFVRIMSIHSSKGLEFPVVILVDCERDIHSKPMSSVCRLNLFGTDSEPALGVYMPYRRKTKHVSRDSYGIDAFRIQDFFSELSEEARLLYVAMTRAQRKLYILGSAKLPEAADRWNSFDDMSRTLRASSYLDMVMPSVLDFVTIPEVDTPAISSPFWSVRVVSPRNVQEGTTFGSVSTIPVVPCPTDLTAEWEAIRDSFLPYPVRTSVTAVLNNSWLAPVTPVVEDDDDETVVNDTIKSFALPKDMVLPGFMQDMTASAANTGTLVHRFIHIAGLLKDVPDESLETVLESDLKSMVDRQIFTAYEASVIRPFLPVIRTFLMSELCHKMRASKLFRSEYPFVHFMSLPSGKLVSVQGTIDAMYLNDAGHWCIIDYKTDKDARASSLISHHMEQLNWYRLAIEAMSGIPVDEMWVVSMRTGRSVSIPVFEPESFVLDTKAGS